MNLQLIKEIINSFLKNKKNFNKKLLLNTNKELSRTLVCLNDDNIKVNKKAILNPKGVVSKIKKHYTKYKNYIFCNFKINDLK